MCHQVEASDLFFILMYAKLISDNLYNSYDFSSVPIGVAVRTSCRGSYPGRLPVRGPLPSAEHVRTWRKMLGRRRQVNLRLQRNGLHRQELPFRRIPKDLRRARLVGLHETRRLLDRHRWQRPLSTGACSLRVSGPRGLHEDHRRAQSAQPDRRSFSFGERLQFQHQVSGVHRRYAAGTSFSFAELQSVHQVRLLQGAPGVAFSYLVR